MEFHYSVLIIFPKSVFQSIFPLHTYLVTASSCTEEAMRSLFLSAGRKHKIFCSHMTESENDILFVKLETRSSKCRFMLRIDCNKYQNQHEKHRRTHEGAHIPVKLKSDSTIKQILIIFKSFPWSVSWLNTTSEFPAW